MSYQKPGSGLGGAHARKVELSQEIKKPLNRSADSNQASTRALALHREHVENQAKLKAAYESRKPHPPKKNNA